MGRLTQAILKFGKAETSAALASAVDFGLTIFLAKIVKIWYAQASFFGALAGGIINCYVNYRWVFDKQEQRKPLLILKYFVVWSFSILFNTAFLEVPRQCRCCCGYMVFYRTFGHALCHCKGYCSCNCCYFMELSDATHLCFLQFTLAQ